MMTRLISAITLALLAGIGGSSAQQPARIESFSPMGTVKRVRQVQVRFSAPMVPFGDPHPAVQPFDITCSEPGTPRWVDDRNWVYDFERDLPAGVRCEFRLSEGLRTLGGADISGDRIFRFSTGGPAILRSTPYEGSSSIDENQIFALELDCAATATSVLEHVSFSVDGIANRIAARILPENESQSLIKSIFAYRRAMPEHLLLIQATQTFPADTRVALIWGAGVEAPSGIASDQDQVLPFETRPTFSARFHCQRENPEAACIPITSMSVDFTAPVSRDQASRITLKSPDGRQWPPQEENGAAADAFTRSITFQGPFPERSAFTLELPVGLKDDAGRELTNASNYPLTVKTDEYPPLAKFASAFGILELKGNPLLPVTLRNVEPSVAARMMEVEEGQQNIDPPRELAIGVNQQVAAQLAGKIYKVPAETANEMLFWIKKVDRRTWEDRDKSVFGTVTGSRATKFDVPKLHGDKAFEVVGIPLKSPGFYVVELESELLGAALLGAAKPMYVPTTVLVTNLSVHFKWGNESSLVWVTTLDKGKPVSGAAVRITDCEGRKIWEGKTDRDGLVRIGKLPSADELPRCSYDPYDSGLLIAARASDDMAFAHTSWNEGIEPWRFQLPIQWNPATEIAHTIFDRTLFRPGETVHMKHILRGRTLAGFAAVRGEEIGGILQIRHQGSSQRYELALHWDAAGVAESDWNIPKDAMLGYYQVALVPESRSDSRGSTRGGVSPDLVAGSFRVEEYRVPLMKAVIRPPSEDLVSPSEVPVDINVQYLGGGGAGMLPVTFRYLLESRYVFPPQAYEGYSFSRGKVREGLVRAEAEPPPEANSVQSRELTLDRTGSARTDLAELPEIEVPMGILAELDFKDPNGEVQTASTRIPLWPSSRMIGIKPDGWALSRDAVKFRVAVLDLSGKPVSGAFVRVDLLQRKTYSHRKRLVGGFYAYEHSTEISRLQTLCTGRTDRRGLLLCEKPVSESGNLILQASTTDPDGHESATYRDVWVAGSGDWWFTVTDSDRMDVIPEETRYEPGEKARFQVRMPFRKATALITVEREGVGETFIKELSGKEPVIELPVKGDWAPNVFVSVLAVRGRSGDVQPTATVDLGRPSFKLGIAEIRVGWKANELNVNVTTDRQVYKVREKARAKIAVSTADGKPLPPGSEVAVAAVDEGLLELMPNNSWNLLEAMMARRSYGVQTSTAQMNVIGKRHFGLKALPQGGGGGQTLTRELFDTLLLWKGRLRLDEHGEASIEIPLNDALTSFRIAAVATGGLNRFGTGWTSIRTTQDLILFSGIPPLVRQGDQYQPTFTVRNATERGMQVRVTAGTTPAVEPLPSQEIALASGESKELRWNITAPGGTDTLTFNVEASGDGGAADRLSVAQKVIPAIPVRTYQATLTRVEKTYRMDVEQPADALAGLGGIRVSFRPRLADGLTGVADYMQRYPYSCLEQVVSKAIALRDKALWERILGVLPLYLDGAGLAKYFPSALLGSDTLTSYILAIADEAKWEIPAGPRSRMITGLQGFVGGQVTRYSDMPTADLTIRKLAAIEALSRIQQAPSGSLSSIVVNPNLWPTSAVIDWFNILSRIPDAADRAARLQEAQQILRSRLNFQGTTMGFSTERMDALYWLMISVDSNALRLLLSQLNSPGWRDDIPRLVQGALGRQRFGHWDTTVANAWGVLAMEKFSAAFENIPVTGTISATVAGRSESVDWQANPGGGALSFAWPANRSALEIEMRGSGTPWATIQSRAAIPLRGVVSSGFSIRKTLTPVERKEEGSWNAGDVVRIRLDIESQADMTWVVVNDPVPAGSVIFGTGLGRDSSLSTRGEERKGWAWPAFEERSQESYRAYYRFVPKGEWSLEYTVRLNSSGTLQLPPTRVEAMYAPEMFGELPNNTLRVK